MGAKKKQLFDHKTNRNAELGLVVSSSARIEILSFLENHHIMNIPMLLQYIPLHQKTISHHVHLIERSGLIEGYYIGNKYFWSKNEKMLDDWDKISWALI
jgi:predicted transcriptional regulator